MNSLTEFLLARIADDEAVERRSSRATVTGAVGIVGSSDLGMGCPFPVRA